MNKNIIKIFERVCGPLKRVSDRLAVGRCPSCRAGDSLFIDLATGDFRCGRIPDALVHGQEISHDVKSVGKPSDSGLLGAATR